MYRIILSLVLVSFTSSVIAQNNFGLPSLFGDHMVLQRNQNNPVWGWANPGETVTITMHDQSHQTVADEEGNWKIILQPIPVGGPYEMEVSCEHSSFIIHDILVGEVWICSGQSNMQWPVEISNHADLEILSANHPQIRFISVPQVGTQEPQKDFDGAWTACTPLSVKSFSAVGYFFGRRLQQTLHVPIGLIDNAWGGSAAEAWVNRMELENSDRFAELLSWWEERESTYDYEALLEEWQAEVQKWEENGKQGQEPRKPWNLMMGNHRPANIYNGVLHPTIGYGIRGVIWYQGESNAGRAYQYRDLFPFMIQNWRDEWGQGDFPFYYVQLADFLEESTGPEESAWAELREAQTMTMRTLGNVGEAVIIDVGEGRDIHPRDKQTVANRLARWALARDYGYQIDYRSPQFRSMEVVDNKIVLTFNHVRTRFYTFDINQPLGFTIAGEDQKFVIAEAKITGDNQIEVWSDEVSNPVAVRYAWANNPVCNVYSREGLPLTPFRTDNWDGVTKGIEHNQ